MSTASTADTSRKRPTGESVGIPPRRISFPHGELNRYFCGNNPFASHAVSLLSGVFPEGERFFMDSVKHYRQQITDPVLQAKVSGFIGQEALHGREHDRLNDQLRTLGIPVGYAERAVRIGLWPLRRLSPLMQLACTTVMEDFTAALAESLLRNPEFQAQVHPTNRGIWLWHCVEELEHKSVAFSVYKQVGGTDRRRRVAVGLVLAALLPTFAVALACMLAREGSLFKRGMYKEGFGLIFGRYGLMNRVPKFFKHSLKDGFHPEQHDTRALEEAWRQALFGEQGSLTAHMA